MEPTSGMNAKPLTPELTQMVQTLPSSLLQIIDWFEDQGHFVWIVGGAVRNLSLIHI